MKLFFFYFKFNAGLVSHLLVSDGHQLEALGWEPASLVFVLIWLIGRDGSDLISLVLKPFYFMDQYILLILIFLSIFVPMFSGQFCFKDFSL